MDQQEQNSNNILKDSNEFSESSKSLPPTNSIHSNFKNLNIGDYVHELDGSNQDINDLSKYLDLQRMLVDQENATMTLKMSEYEKSLAEKDNTIKSLYTKMMNSQNNNHILTNKCKNIMEKTKLLSHSCVRLNESFTNIFDRLNKLEDTVNNAKTRQQNVMTLVDQTTNTFQEKIQNISDNIDDSFNQANIEKIKAKQDLEILENKYSLDMNAFKFNLEECTKEIENLKTENTLLLEKLNETNMRLNEEKEMVLNLNQNYEKVLKEMEDQNLLLINQNKSLNIKYEEMFCENQSLKDEINIMNISLDENKKQLDMKLTLIKEQTELLNNLKISEELNDALKKDNFSLKEHKESLEKNHTCLLEEISKMELSHKEILEEKESKFKDMCNNYDNLLKMQEEKLIETTKQLCLQNEKECIIQAEVIDLKQEIDVSNKKIFNLQEELKTNNILISELQNKIDDLNTNLTYQKLQDNEEDQKNITEINELKKEKSELENQVKEHFKQIEKITVNCMKYKSKAKQLYVEVMRLRFQRSPSKLKNTPQKYPILETIELESDDENMENDDCITVELNNKDITNIDVCTQSTSNKVKRNSSPTRQINNSKVKKRMASNDISCRISAVSSKGLKQEIDNSLNCLSKSTNLKFEDKNVDEIKSDCHKIEFNNKDMTNMDVSIQSISNIKKRNSSPLRQIINSEVKKRKTSIDNISSEVVNKEKNQDLQNKESNISQYDTFDMDKKNKNQVPKKQFKIPADMMPPQKKSKPTNIQNVDWSKPNSPVMLIPAPKRNPQPKATGQ